VIMSLDAVSGDALSIGELVLGDDEASLRFEDIADAAAFDPFLIVGTFRVDPEWRGTVLTPVLAARMLEPFAALGVQAAALLAAPIQTEDMTAEEFLAAQTAIARMWTAIGFRPLSEDGYMAAALDPAVFDDVTEAATEQIPDLRFS
jgi:hypothetical protein